MTSPFEEYTDELDTIFDSLSSESKLLALTAAASALESSFDWIVNDAATLAEYRRKNKFCIDVVVGAQERGSSRNVEDSDPPSDISNSHYGLSIWIVGDNAYRVANGSDIDSFGVMWYMLEPVLTVQMESRFGVSDPGSLDEDFMEAEVLGSNQGEMLKWTVERLLEISSIWTIGDSSEEAFLTAQGLAPPTAI